MPRQGRISRQSGSALTPCPLFTLWRGGVFALGAVLAVGKQYLLWSKGVLALGGNRHVPDTHLARPAHPLLPRADYRGDAGRLHHATPVQPAVRADLPARPLWHGRHPGAGGGPPSLVG